MKFNKYFFLVLILAITASCSGSGGGSSNSNATTQPTLVSIAISPSNPSIALGTTKQFTATGTYSDDTTEDLTTSATWTSSFPSVATISNDTGSNGKASTASAGTTTITATSGSISASTTLTVTSATLLSISITPASPSIAPGTTEQFFATGTFSDNTTQDLTTVATWSSSDGSVATIVNAACTIGKAAAIAAGTTTITATSGGTSGSTTLTVTSATLSSLTVLPINPSIALGTTQQFAAQGTFSDNTTQDLTSSATWSSSSPSVATISNAACTIGNAFPVSSGTTTITATSGSISDATTLTVTPPTLQSIAITPVNPIIAIGATQQFTATGRYSDNSIQDLTSSVTWTSSFPPVAAVSNATGSNGLATALAAGNTRITALSSTAPAMNGSTGLFVTAASGTNVIPISVNGGTCSNTYPNKPCVSVTVCSLGTSTCQTVNDILLDTGSYGLRIFKQVLSVPLSQVTVSSQSLAECVQFGDGSSMWGPVEKADVILGGEPAVTVPIQVIDSTFGTSTLPSQCSNADLSPAAARLNGILGVGLFVQDCGSACVSIQNNGMYFGCNLSSCSTSTVPLASQVQDPVAHLPSDNNGVLLLLPSIPLGGVTSVNGSLILGIGTQPNNTISGVTSYPADPNTANFTTIFNSTSYSASFIDSGSNALYFSDNQLPVCSGWYCPASTQSLSAITKGYLGSPSGTVSFQISNANSLFSTSNNVFVDLGGNLNIGGFDWGLPFFFGRNVFVGFDGMTSSLGTGPYWAY